MTKTNKSRLIHGMLFVVTVISTTLAGAEWMFGNLFFFVSHPMGWDEFFAGFEFSIPFLLILTCHEFGHYLTARYYDVKVSLPYYIPAWFGFIGIPSLGTMGAFIRLREQVKTLKVTFDIGIAGPLAGFVVALFVIFYGFTHLPPKDYIYKIHPEYELFGENYSEYVYDKDTFWLKSDLERINPLAASNISTDTVRIGPSYQLGIKLGTNILFELAKAYIVPHDARDRIPNAHEMFHYPWLFAGFLALLLTAINLLPIGQLDGGHVLYGLVGNKRFQPISLAIYFSFLVFSGLGVGLFDAFNPFDLSQPPSKILLAFVFYWGFLFIVTTKMQFSLRWRVMYSLGVLAVQEIILLLWPTAEGYGGWLLFAFIVGRILGVYHPRSPQEEPLSLTRKILGWIALIIFIISFSPYPFFSTQ